MKLWRVSSISSAPLMELDDADLALSGSEDETNVSDSSTSGFRFPGESPGTTAADILVSYC